VTRNGIYDGASCIEHRGRILVLRVQREEHSPVVSDPLLSAASADDVGVVVGGDGFGAESGPADRWSAGLVVTLSL
jgi:hypothetical protein